MFGCACLTLQIRRSSRRRRSFRKRRDFSGESMARQLSVASNVIAIGDDRVPLATTEKILDTAEALFMEHGFEATSLRAITTAAGVNLASVNYHFGSKEEL